MNVNPSAAGSRFTISFQVVNVGLTPARNVQVKYWPQSGPEPVSVSIAANYGTVHGESGVTIRESDSGRVDLVWATHQNARGRVTLGYRTVWQQHRVVAFEVILRIRGGARSWFGRSQIGEGSPLNRLGVSSCAKSPQRKS